MFFVTIVVVGVVAISAALVAVTHGSVNARLSGFAARVASSSIWMAEKAHREYVEPSLCALPQP